MLRYSIPGFRLPIEVLNWEINLLLSNGVKFLPRRRLGENLGLDDLEGYDAVFLGLGAWTPAKLGIEGQEHSSDGLELLKSVRRGDCPQIRGPVAVIGRGNTSIDVARTLLRLGASPTIYYRRRLEDMPASPAEIVEAMEEGISIQTLLSPQRIKLTVGGGLRITFSRMRVLEGGVGGGGRLIPSGDATTQIEVAAIFTGD
jgi:NADPH-dependent glutamate synthase beta subunit-like oxidoreductase